MIRVSITVAFGLMLTFGSCASGEADYDFVKPGKLMAEMIQDRIHQIPYQHKSELLTNLLWLAQAGEQAIPDLAEALEDPKPKVRSSVAWVFGRMGDRRTIRFLKQHTDVNQVVRLEVARSLLLLGDYSRVPELIGGLDSELQHIRYLCYDALHATTGKSFEYDHRAVDPTDREVSIGKWQEWWRGQSADWARRAGSSLGEPAAPQGR